MVDVQSIDHLLSLSRKLESRKVSIDSYVPPPRNKGNLMEPDLACLYSSSSSRTSSVADVNEIALGTTLIVRRDCVGIVTLVDTWLIVVLVL